MSRSVLESVLLRPIPENTRTRRYQALADAHIDHVRPNWDAGRGLVLFGDHSDAMNDDNLGEAPRFDASLPMPHETMPDYWHMTPEQRQAVTPPEIAMVYRRNAGREGTAVACEAAFCWSSPLSRHYRDPELLQYFHSSLRFHTSTIRDTGLMASYGLNGEYWAHGWDIEGLIYGLVRIGDGIDPVLRDFASERFARSAQRMMRLPEEGGESIGSYGNQRCVWLLALTLFGHWLDDRRVLDTATRWYADIIPKVLDGTGQVVEQHGPCMHYSFTAFIYAWLNVAFRQDDASLKRVANCLQWFRRRYTRSGDPMAGPSSRMFYERVPGTVRDLLPAAEQMVDGDPSIRWWVDHAVAKSVDPARRFADPLTDASFGRMGRGHSASITMWSSLMCRHDDDDPATPAGDERFAEQFSRTTLTKRTAINYAHVRRRYQTQFTMTDYLPFSGIQTWAWEDEPPIVQGTPLHPSTTLGYGLDTARQGVSHNWGMFGAGAMGIDGYLSKPADSASPGEPCFVVARYHMLWRIAVFTACSTVVHEFGAVADRRTLWTLNRLEPAEPVIEGGTVRFAGRIATLQVEPKVIPTLVAATEDDEWARGALQLVYETGDQAVTFGFSNGSLRLKPQTDQMQVCFRDDDGHYELHLDPRFFAPNPGNFSVDVWQFTYHGVTVTHRR